ncbi:hypothetical protein [Emticicia fontis]
MKDFNSLALRNLGTSENQDVVRILNNFMQKKGILTGEAALKALVRDYDKVSAENIVLKTQKELKEDELNTKIKILTSQKEQLLKALFHYTQFQNILNELSKIPDSG